MSFLQRLRERKLVQWSLAYLAGAWVVLQVVDVLGEQWEWSLALQRGISVLLAAGVLVAIVLAWYHGEKGRQDVTAIEAGLLLLLGIGGVGLALAVARGGDVPSDTVAVQTGDGGRPALAALPFVNRSNVAEDAYFTDGVRDEILTKLIGLSGIRVVSRSSVMAYRESSESLPQIASELGSRYILEGGLSRAGDRVRIDVKLFDGPSDTQLWAENFDRTLSVENLLDIQSEIAEQVAAALGSTIGPGERGSLESAPTADLTALDRYFLARAHWRNRDTESLRRAIGLFESALEIDPEFARAHAGLSDALAIQSYHYLPSSQDRWTEAESSARRAIELDPTLAEAYASLGFILTYGRWDWTGAEAAFRRAIALDPSYPVAHYWYCELLIATLRPAEAEAACVRAIEVDRRSAVAHNVLNMLYFNEGRLQEGLAAAKEAARFAPDWPAAYNQLALFSGELGDSALFHEAFPRSALGFLDPHLAFRALAPPQDQEAAIQLVQALDRAAGSGTHSVSATIFARNGISDSTAHRLEAAAREREDFLPLIHPGLDRFLENPSVLVPVRETLGVGRPQG